MRSTCDPEESGEKGKVPRGIQDGGEIISEAAGTGDLGAAYVQYWGACCQTCAKGSGNRVPAG